MSTREKNCQFLFFNLSLKSSEKKIYLRFQVKDFMKMDRNEEKKIIKEFI